MKRRYTLYFLLISLLFISSFFAAMLLGEYFVEPSKIFALLYSKLSGTPYHWGDFGDDFGMTKAQEVIIWRIRMPRLVLAIGSGIALSIAGAAYQGCFRNPLVEPYILGVSSGAACGAALAIVFPHIFINGQLSSFAFAMAAVYISYSLARNKERIPPVALVLSGIIVGALFSSIVGIMKYLAADTQLREITFWMLGGLYYATWDDAVLITLVVFPSLVFLYGFSWSLNVLSLGDDEARTLGVNPMITRLIIIVLATLVAAVAVSICGIIAWVGLMTPHAARLIFGQDHRYVIPASALLGCTYLLTCDTLARTLTQAEIPLGIITSLLGAPYLLWLLRSKGRELYGM